MFKTIKMSSRGHKILKMALEKSNVSINPSSNVSTTVEFSDSSPFEEIFSPEDISKLIKSQRSFFTTWDLDILWKTLICL